MQKMREKYFYVQAPVIELHTSIIQTSWQIKKQRLQSLAFFTFFELFCHANAFSSVSYHPNDHV
jgi:hypothetical protein